MANHLEAMARRLEEDPFFLACPLRLYAASEQLDEEALAQSFGSSGETLIMLRLCRAPRAETFRADVDRIASRFQINGDLLAEAVRRGQALLQMRKTSGLPGTLMAARDAEDQDEQQGKGDHS